MQSRCLYSVSFVDGIYGWIVGEQGAIFRTRTGAVNGDWERQAVGLTDRSLRSVQFVSRSTGWAVGDQGVVLHTKDGGGKHPISTVGS